MPNLVGQQFGNYHLTLLRERTAFTEIYRAEQSESGTQVSFKALRPELSTEEQEHFLEAAQALLELEHPNITRVIEVGQADNEDAGFPYIVVEHISEQTLRQLHPIGERLSPATILAYVRPLAEALHHAHQQNFIHGDVKPGNIFVGDAQRVVLSDFSTGLLARLTDTVIGTIAYVAPEQLQGEASSASDQYALGVIVYEWLSGELPFSGSAGEISRQHLTTAPPSLLAKIPELPPALEEAVFTALAKEPEQRFASVLDFASALEAALPVNQDEPFVSSSATQLPQLGSASAEESLLAEPSTDWEAESARPEMLPAVPGALLVPPSEVEETRPRSFASSISRRALLVGLPALVVAASGFASWYFNQKASTPGEARSSASLLVYRGHSGPVTALAWSPDGAYLASGGDDHSIQIWQPESGSSVYIFRGSSGSVPAVTWAPDSRRLASASAGPSTSGGAPAQGNAVQVWYALTGKAIYSYYGHASGITSVAWDPKGERIASASTDYTVQIWDATTGKQPLVHRTPPWYVWTLAWSPDGQQIASGGPATDVQVWQAATGTSVATYQGHTGSVESVDWSPDGSRVASGSDDHTVRVWSVANKSSMLIYRGHTDYVRAVAWSPNGEYLASGSNDETVQVWHASTGTNIATYHGHSASVTTVAWSPDSKSLASGSQDGTVHIWQPFSS